MLDYNFLFISAFCVYIFMLYMWIQFKYTNFKIFFFTLFYIYTISVIAITLFPIPIDLRNTFYSKGSNLIPFWSITEISLNERITTGNKIRQIFGNIILFVPLGFFVSYVFKHIGFKKICIISLLCSLGIESTQFLISVLLGFNYRVIDIDDVILNTLGGVVGYFLYRIFVKYFFRK